MLSALFFLFLILDNALQGYNLFYVTDYSKVNL